jgi:hypothetical protein
MKKRLLIYCEGQTEEMIVERIFRNHLAQFGIKVERPELAATSLDPQGQRGGFVNWEAIQFDLHQILAEDPDPDLRVTTFLDVYAMPPKVLALAGLNAPIGAIPDIEAVETEIEKVFSDTRFKAYLQRHELEALLLAAPDALETVFHRDKAGIQQLRADISGFGNAEDINHGQTTHPSARLIKAISGYKSLKA